MTAPAESDICRLLEVYRDAPDGFLVVGKINGRLALVVLNGEVLHSTQAGWRKEAKEEATR